MSILMPPRRPLRCGTAAAAALAPGAAAGAAAAAAIHVLGFLPWSGCGTEGSPYDTGARGPLAGTRRAAAFFSPARRHPPHPTIAGVRGVPGRDCQEVYQPALAAERRAVALLRRQQQQPGGEESPQRQPPASAPPPREAPAAAPAAKEEAAALTPEQRRAAEDLMRSIMLHDQRARTQELVDAAWQSLE
jgi:hypothetical protein